MSTLLLIIATAAGCLRPVKLPTEKGFNWYEWEKAKMEEPGYKFVWNK